MMELMEHEPNPLPCTSAAWMSYIAHPARPPPPTHREVFECLLHIGRINGTRLQF